MTDTAKPMITLQQIRDAGPCESGWRKLNKTLGNPDLSVEISIGDVVLSNGLDDALWCLRVLPPRERVAAIMPSVRRASARTSDPRVHECIADIDRWLAGDASVDMRAARAVTDVLAERERQINAEGWSSEHDDGHDKGQLAKAAAAYAQSSVITDAFRRKYGTLGIPLFWPFAKSISMSSTSCRPTCG